MQTLLFTLDDVSGFRQKTLVNSHSFRAPPLEKKRHLFNNSHIGSVNSLWKTGEHSQFRLNVQYLYDMSEENSMRNSEYFLPEGPLKNYRYTSTIGDFLDLTNVYFMSSYRNFSKRSGVLPLNRRQSLNANIQFRNPLTIFFFNTGITYSPSTRNLVSSLSLVGTESVSGNKELSTKSDMIIWSAYAGKYFAEIRTNVSLSVNYNSIKSQRQQQNVLYPLRASVWVFMPKVNVKISDNSSVTYQAVASNRVTEITSDKSVKMLFADISVTYKVRQLEFDLSWNNIFNQKSYSYSIYSELDKFDYTYSLRPSILILSVSFKY